MLLKNYNFLTKKSFKYSFNIFLKNYLTEVRTFVSKIIISEIYYKLIKTNKEILTYEKSFHKIKKNSFVIKCEAYCDLYSFFEPDYNILQESNNETFESFKKVFNKLLNSKKINNNLFFLINTYQLDINKF